MGAQLGPAGRGVSPLLQGDSLGPQPESLSSAMTSAPGTLGLFLILRIMPCFTPESSVEVCSA